MKWKHHKAGFYSTTGFRLLRDEFDVWWLSDIRKSRRFALSCPFWTAKEAMAFAELDAAKRKG